MYLDFEKPGPPPVMQETLNAFIQRRAGELATEQVMAAADELSQLRP
jgi:hypothetical protein